MKRSLRCINHPKFVLKMFSNMFYGIHKKLFLSFTLLFFILLPPFVTLVYYSISKPLKAEQDNYIYNVTKQLYNSIEQNIVEMKNLSINLSLDQNIQEYIKAPLDSQYDDYIYFNKMSKELNRLRLVKNYLHLCIVSDVNRSAFTANSDRGAFIRKDIDSKSLSFLDSTKKNASDMSIISRLDSTGLFPYEISRNSFAIITRIKDGTNTSGYIILINDYRYFRDILKGTNFSNIDFFNIVDSEGQIIYFSDQNKFNRLNMRENKLDSILSTNKKNIVSSPSGSYLVTQNSFGNIGWSIVTFSSEKVFRKSLNEANSIIIMFSVIFVVLLIMMIYFVSILLTKPIKKLTTALTYAVDKNFQVRVDIKNNDEIGELARNFNIMLDEIKFLINSVIEKERLKKESEISALQQQISPHFLYNTLESISSIAYVSNCREICTITQKLGDMLRYNLNRAQKELVSIYDEIEHLQSYIAIQKIQYSDRFEVIIDIPLELYYYQTIKFIFQPLVENSIKHGFYDLQRPGIIVVTGQKVEQSIALKIIDNGIGINEEELENIRNSLQNATQSGKTKTPHIGLMNVHSRLVYNFGEEYGLKIHSVAGQETTIEILIPALEGSGD